MALGVLFGDIRTACHPCPCPASEGGILEEARMEGCSPWLGKGEERSESFLRCQTLLESVSALAAVLSLLSLGVVQVGKEVNRAPVGRQAGRDAEKSLWLL